MENKEIEKIGAADPEKVLASGPGIVNNGAEVKDIPAEAQAEEPKTFASGTSGEPDKKGRSKKKKSKGKAKDEKPLTPEEAAEKARKKRKRQIREIKTFLFRLAAMVIMLYVLLGVVFGIQPAKNDDMKPRISAGDLMLYYRLNQRYVANDVVVYEHDGHTYVGRIVAQGGDVVDISDTASLIVNGSTVIESDIYYSTPKYDTDAVTYPVTLADDEVFLLCDYRTGAKDSRAFGPIKKSDFKGKVITVVRRSSI